MVSCQSAPPHPTPPLPPVPHLVPMPASYSRGTGASRVCATRMTEPEAVLPESSLPELPNTTTEEEIIDHSVLDNQFARVLAWRAWRLSPFEDFFRQVSDYITEEPYVLEWIGCQDIARCMDLQFLEGILEEKKSSLRGKSTSEMVVPQQEATCRV
ncbi:unnamed protein product [Cuscuta europaea]|uniref:Uncharacterized protein n=1 Tax=Cuscuta europaea TaxID=41803 RepID=A0A9P1EKT8_CUSEU|nr:unnamed protein product [Cuscuta europaea]